MVCMRGSRKIERQYRKGTVNSRIYSLPRRIPSYLGDCGLFCLDPFIKRRKEGKQAMRGSVENNYLKPNFGNSLGNLC